MESSRSFYKATQRQRALVSLMSAIETLSRGSLELEETLKRVMNEARKLMDADRISLWLLDDEKGELWANIEMADGRIQEIRIPKNSGFAGQVVDTSKPLNIPLRFVPALRIGNCAKNRQANRLSDVQHVVLAGVQYGK